MRGAFVLPGSELVGREVLGVRIAPGIEQALEKGSEVVVDFTVPAASLQHASVCADRTARSSLVSTRLTKAFGILSSAPFSW